MTDTIKVKPIDIDLSTNLHHSRLGSDERNRVAANFIRICQENFDQKLGFQPLTYQNYLQLSASPANAADKEILKNFVTEGLMTFENDAYSATDAFINAVKMFLH